MIRKEAWPFYRTISGVFFVGSSKNQKDLKDLTLTLRPPGMEGGTGVPRS